MSTPCPTCSYWAREFASLDEHHPACPHHPSATPTFPEFAPPPPPPPPPGEPDA